MLRPQFDAIGYQLPLDPLADQWSEELLRIRLSWVWVPPYSRLVPLTEAGAWGVGRTCLGDEMTKWWGCDVVIVGTATGKPLTATELKDAIEIMAETGEGPVMVAIHYDIGVRGDPGRCRISLSAEAGDPLRHLVSDWAERLHVRLDPRPPDDVRRDLWSMSYRMSPLAEGVTRPLPPG